MTSLNSTYDETEARFKFGNNWWRFLKTLNNARIIEAENTLKKCFSVDSLKGLTFLDLGSGSGLFSLAAHRLGAKVHSFDYDPQSVECAKSLKEQFFPNSKTWVIEQGSILDKTYISKLNKFDIVYSFGVLHHTGNMWDALKNAGSLVKENGKLYISIYNDQGGYSKRWTTVKRLYNSHGRFVKTLLLLLSFTYIWGRIFLYDLLRRGNPFYHWANYSKNRGMSAWHDLVDWVGGYPFEVATPEAIIKFFQKDGYILEDLVTRQGIGCNEFVFKKVKKG